MRFNKINLRKQIQRASYVVMVVAITWAYKGIVCMICMPEAQLSQARGIRALNHKCMHMLQVSCNTFIAIVTTPVG